MELEAWCLKLEAWSLRLLSLFFYNSLDDDMRMSLVFGVRNIFNRSSPALPAALALAALVRRWTCFILSISYGRRPGPALARCAVNLSC